MCSERVALAFLVGACAEKAEESEPVIRPVRYQQVFATGGSRIRTFSGTVQAGVESRISFKVPGTVIEVKVKVGDSVRKGQLIARIDPKDFKLRMQEAEAALTQAVAAARNARSQHERVMALWENRNAAKGDLDAARAARESAEAAVQSIEKRLEQARLQVSYTKLTAPVSGSIAEVMVEVNENVLAGTPILVLTSGDVPEVRVAVPEAMIAQVQVGSPATVMFGALADESFEATVTEVGVSATEYATTFPVTVRLKTKAPDIRPGMAAEVSFRIETSDTRERILVPPVSVGEDRQGRYVFILEPTEDGFGITRRRPVTVGELTADGLEIFDGLVEGELVVTAGVSKIIDGQKVRLL